MLYLESRIGQRGPQQVFIRRNGLQFTRHPLVLCSSTLNSLFGDEERIREGINIPD